MANSNQPKNLVSLLNHGIYNGRGPDQYWYRRQIIRNLYQSDRFQPQDYIICDMNSPHDRTPTFDLRKNLIIASDTIHNRPRRDILKLIPGNFMLNQRQDMVEHVCSAVSTNEDLFTTLRCQWYPYDLGMYSILIPKQLELYDSSRMLSICEFTKPAGIKKFNHMDWNNIDFRTIALSCECEEVLLFDVRIGGSAMTVIANDDNLKASGTQSATSTTVVYWSPVDNHGLFIGTKSGSILFFDTRQPRRPVCSQISSWILNHPVNSLQMTPDHQQLISIHFSSSNFLYRWKFDHPATLSDRFLRYVPNIEPFKNFIPNYKRKPYGHVQPWVTNDFVMIISPLRDHQPNPCMLYFPFSKKIEKSQLFSKCHANQMADAIRPWGESGQILHSYGDTAWDLELTPALFFFIGRNLIMRRWKDRNLPTPEPSDYDTIDDEDEDWNEDYDYDFDGEGNWMVTDNYESDD